MLSSSRNVAASGTSATIGVACKPNRATTGVVRIGPSAQPLRPPTANMLMPVPCRPDATET